jgi:putative Mg2+ transporter-C (MgtC) family protein
MYEITNWINSLTPEWQMVIKVVLAGLLGGLFGLERDYHGHDAGLRTNMMIAIASCLFTLLGIQAFPIIPGAGATRDTARVAAQIVVGVGFLGGGVMLQTKNKVRGLTTAATIWLVAAVGMAIGVGFYFLAIFTSSLALAVLIFLAPISRYLEHRARTKTITSSTTTLPSDKDE